MKLEFSWTASPAGPLAVCTSDMPDSNGVSPLSCLLMDDGGLDRSTSLAWLREGIARVDFALAGGTKAHIDWDREDWGASLMESETKVYSLRDEDCAERIPTSQFRRALAEWVAFIEAGGSLSSASVDLT